MKRLIFCLVVSAAVVLYLATALGERPASQASGERYWNIIFSGRGRELVREEGRVYFYVQGRHGWRYYWADEAPVNAARVKAVQEHLRLLHPPFSTAERKLFGVLAGKAFEDDAGMAAWLREAVSTAPPTEERVVVFLVEREKLCRTLAAAWEEGDMEPDIDFWGASYTSLLQYAPYLYMHGSDGRIVAWVNRVRVRRSFAIEAVCFPLIIFFLVCAVPALWRGLGRLGAPDWLRCGIVVVAANAAVGAPAGLGHGPDPTRSGATDGAIVYHSLFLATQCPTGALVPSFLRPVVGIIALGPAHTLACVFPPVLAENRSWPPSPQAIGLEYMLLPVWGCMFYGVAAMLFWCAWEATRDRWRRASGATRAVSV